MSPAPTRFSEIAHARLDFFAPFSWETLDAAFTRIDLSSSDRVLDAGCGAGRLLIEIVQRYGCTGLGIDLSPTFIDRAQSDARAREVDARCRFVVGDVATSLAGEQPFDLLLCVGSTHAFGGFEKTFEAGRSILREGGRALVGEGYWKGEPDPGYLKHLEATADEYTSHAGNIERAGRLGYDLIWDHESSLEEWDAYEGAYAAGIHSHVADHPEDPEGAAMLKRITEWNDAYERWGRETLGFGVYLLQLR